MKSDAIMSRLFVLPALEKATVVFTYLHFRSEVQTSTLVQELFSTNRDVCIPVTLSKDSQLLAVKVTDVEQQIAPGYCGIPEPVPEVIQGQTVDPATIDIVVVPGSVFDRHGGRLGYGGGYYDRFLANDSPRAARIGLAFDLQVVETVPVEPHDQRMDYIVTETQTYDCRSYRYAKSSSVS
jgi:5-formyltetrahydrofolate cyclo-ligase